MEMVTTVSFEITTYGIHDDSGNHFAVQTSVKQKAIMVITNPTKNQITAGSSFQTSNFKWLSMASSNSFCWMPM